MALILDGRPVRDKIAARLKRQISGTGARPALAIIQVGRDPAADLFIGRKKEFGAKIGVAVKHIRFPSRVRAEAIKASIRRLAADKNVHGIIVQLPLPRRLPTEEILASIPPAKDVDGLTAGSGFLPATAKGIWHLLRHYHQPIAGRRAVVIGRSRLVGKPIALILLNQGATVTIGHRQTKNLAAVCRQADILISAAGQPGLVGLGHTSRRQVIIDVGISTNKTGHLVGDVNFAKVAPRVKAISPVPGGVGPLTVASLFENLVLAWQKR